MPPRLLSHPITQRRSASRPIQAHKCDFDQTAESAKSALIVGNVFAHDIIIPVRSGRMRPEILFKPPRRKIVCQRKEPVVGFHSTQTRAASILPTHPCARREKECETSPASIMIPVWTKPQKPCGAVLHARNALCTTRERRNPYPDRPGCHPFHNANNPPWRVVCVMETSSCLLQRMYC